MELTPDEFVEELPKWYCKYRENNQTYFPMEERIAKKASSLGFLEMTDLVEITHALGNPHNIRGKVQRTNTDDEVKDRTREAIQSISEPASALKSTMGIRQWGRTYASKTLRCICSRDYAALDDRLIKGISHRYLRSQNELQRYEGFLRLCREIKERLSEPGPRQGGEWFIADVEMALFQFVWDGNKIVEKAMEKGMPQDESRRKELQQKCVFCCKELVSEEERKATHGLCSECFHLRRWMRRLRKQQGSR